METNTYWALVERARHGSADVWETAAKLKDLLVELPAEVIVAAGDCYSAITAPSYTWRLWGAAYIINGGCGDDGFDYFRGWLVAQGRAVYEAALADADSLADVVTADDADEAFCEEMLGAPYLAYRERFDDYIPAGTATPRPELGEGWDFDDEDEMRARYPRLTGIFF